MSAVSPSNERQHFSEVGIRCAAGYPVKGLQSYVDEKDNYGGNGSGNDNGGGTDNENGKCH